jgi:hypothetical protein
MRPQSTIKLDNLRIKTSENWVLSVRERENRRKNFHTLWVTFNLKLRWIDVNGVNFIYDQEMSWKKCLLLFDWLESKPFKMKGIIFFLNWR